MTSESASTSDEVLAISVDKKRPRKRWIAEWAVILISALIIAVLVRSYVIQTFYIPSGSMEPTLQIGDRIIVSKLSLTLGSVNRGDIIVFHSPPTEACAGDTPSDLVKRVVGLPGETISSTGETIYINGKKLSEPWTHTSPLGPAISSTLIPTGSYFMMGDNNSNSCDSRYWGTLPRHYMVGKVLLRIWPPSRIGQP
ncbi:MAG: signal peptidase I [Actinomycetota bacterium]